MHNILGRVHLPASDFYGRVCAAEAALAIGANSLARDFLRHFAEEDGRPRPDELLLPMLIRVGEQERAESKLERYLAPRSNDERHTNAVIERVCETYIEVGRIQDAISLAQRVIDGSEDAHLWPYIILAHGRDTEAPLAKLNTIIVEDDNRSSYEWIRLARALLAKNLHEEVRTAALERSREATKAKFLMGLAKLLHELNDPAGDSVLLAAALAENSDYLEVVNQLLRTQYRQEACAILLDHAGGDCPIDLIGGIALTMRSAGMISEAKSFLVQMIRTRDPRKGERLVEEGSDDNFGSTAKRFNEAVRIACSLFADDMLIELRSLAVDSSITNDEAVTIARQLLAAGDRTVARGLIDRFFGPASDSLEDTSPEDGTHPSLQLPVPKNREMELAKLAIEVGRPDGAAAIYRWVLRKEASESDTYIAISTLTRIGLAQTDDYLTVAGYVYAHLVDEQPWMPETELLLVGLSAEIFNAGGYQLGRSFIERIAEIGGDDVQDETRRVLQQIVDSTTRRLAVDSDEA